MSSVAGTVSSYSSWCRRGAKVKESRDAHCLIFLSEGALLRALISTQLSVSKDAAYTTCTSFLAALCTAKKMYRLLKWNGRPVRKEREWIIISLCRTTKRRRKSLKKWNSLYVCVAKLSAIKVKKCWCWVNVNGELMQLLFTSQTAEGAQDKWRNTKRSAKSVE